MTTIVLILGMIPCVCIFTFGHFICWQKLPSHSLHVHVPYVMTICVLTIAYNVLWYQICHNPTFGRMWGWHSHSRNGDLGVLWDSWNFRVQLQGSKHLHWGVFYIIEKLSKCRCRKWARMSHLDICSTSYGKKKGWQFDSRPLKVGNRPDPAVCRGSATHHWKALKESYKFNSDLIPIGGLSKKLWPRKILRVQTGIVSGLLFGSLGTKSHSDVGAVERCREYYMGEGGGFPQVWAMVSLVSPELPVACPSTKGALESELTNLLVGLTLVWISN